MQWRTHTPCTAIRTMPSGRSESSMYFVRFMQWRQKTVCPVPRLELYRVGGIGVYMFVYIYAKDSTFVSMQKELYKTACFVLLNYTDLM